MSGKSSKIHIGTIFQLCCKMLTTYAATKATIAQAAADGNTFSEC